MIYREGSSAYVDSLDIGKRGEIIDMVLKQAIGIIPKMPLAPGQKPVQPGPGQKPGQLGQKPLEPSKVQKSNLTRIQVLNIFDTFKNNGNPKTQKYTRDAIRTLRKGPPLIPGEPRKKDYHREVLNDFINNSKTIPLKAAKTLRQNGIFKIAAKDVYQDLETGDFWKISEDKTHLERMFDEAEDGTTTKTAAKMEPATPNSWSANSQVICAGGCGQKSTYDAAQKAGWEATKTPFKFICPDCNKEKTAANHTEVFVPCVKEWLPEDVAVKEAVDISADILGHDKINYTCSKCGKNHESLVKVFK